MLEPLTEQLKQGGALSSEQVTVAVTRLTDEHVPTEPKADFLTAMARKGETTEEIAAFARELLEKSVRPWLDAETRSREILDVCGTGGDRLGTFNISTTVAIIVAASGVTVAKHGNRAITSQAGSADVLEALGIRIDLTPDEAARSLREHHFAFFFAPKYHPAFKHIAPARKLCAERGQRTIFNFLGPLLNPARPTAQLIGVPRVELCEPIGRVLQSLGVRRGMVVSGHVAPLHLFRPFEFEPTNRIQQVRVIDTEGRPLSIMSVPEAVELAKQRNATLVSVASYINPAVCRLINSATLERLGLDQPNQQKHLDEISTLGTTTIAEFYQPHGFTTSTLSPDQFPLQSAMLVDLLGGEREANASIVRRVLGGEDRGPKRDAVLLNTAAALFVAGKAKSLTDGWEQAGELIDTGKAAAKLNELIAASK